MTLLSTEIHSHNDPHHALIVFAVDRRISNVRTGAYVGTKKKVFEIRSLKAAIGYFGLAELPGARGGRPMQEWLEAFIRKNAGIKTLEEYSKKLASDLNADVPRAWHTTYSSGFHIAGLTPGGRPEFWFVPNMDDNFNLTLDRYEAREEFQRRDGPRLKPGEIQIYRNGDIRAHVTAWETIDKSFGALLTSCDFRALRSSEDYANWVRFKMEVIAYFYKTYQRSPIIARPVDVIVIDKRGVRVVQRPHF